MNKKDVNIAIEVIDKLYGQEAAFLVRRLEMYSRVLGAQSAAQAAFEAAYLCDDHSDWNKVSDNDRSFWHRAAQAAIDYNESKQ